MKVGIITDHMDGKPSGMGNYVKHLVQNLLLFDIDLWLFHGKNNIITDPGVKSLYKRSNEVKISNFLPRGNLHMYPVFLLNYKLDIIHYPSQSISPIFWIGNTKKVVTIHGVAPFILPRTQNKRWPIYLSLTLKYLSGKFDHVITVSESEKSNLCKILKINPKKVSVIYHGVDRNLFSPPINRERALEDIQRKYKFNGPFIFHISSLSPKKNLPCLIKALKEFKQFGFPHKLVIGGGSRDRIFQYKKFSQKLNIEKEVIFVGRLGDELPKFYASADVFVFPSFHEGFGLPILEAMSCGCPVITSNRYSMPEVAGNAAILVDPYSSKDLTNALFKLLINEKLREEKIKAAVKRSKDFDWYNSAKQTYAVYKSLLSC